MVAVVEEPIWLNLGERGVSMKARLSCGVIALAALAAGAAAREIEIHDGFESGELSSNWSRWRFLPGDLEIQGERVRSGRRSVRITLHPGDQMEDERGTILERAELMESRNLVSAEDSAYEYSFSLFLPQDFPIVPDRLVLAQWKQYCESGRCGIDNPVIALRYESGRLYVSLKTDPQKRTLFRESADVRGRWLDFRFLIRFSRTRRGRVNAWLNGSRIVDYEGATAYSKEYGYPAPGYFYFKMGLYRDHVDRVMSIYIDDYGKRTLRVIPAVGKGASREED
jgi:hypothetical protein